MKIDFGPYPKFDEIRKTNVIIDDYDHWSLDVDLAIIISALLKNFKDKTNGIPDVIYQQFNNKENTNVMLEHWQSIIQSMIDAFDIIVESYNDYKKSDEIKVKEGLNNFVNYFSHLWT